MHAVSSDGWRLLGVMMTLALGAASAGAEPCAPHAHCLGAALDPAAARAAEASDSGHAGAAEAIAAEVARPVPIITAPLNSRASDAAGLARRSWSARFVESIDVGGRITALSRFRILRLWDSARITVFFGLDHAGRAGLHVQQQEPGSLPPFRLSSTLVDAPPMRAVPLASR